MVRVSGNRRSQGRRLRDSRCHHNDRSGGRTSMSKTAYRLAGLAFVSGLVGLATMPVNAQLLTHKDLSVAMATTMAMAAVDACKAQGYNVSVHVLGRDGQVIVALRNEKAGLATFENSLKKAYTARTFRIPSGQFANNVKGNPN